MPRHKRETFSHALRRIVHATEDLVDDALDRSGDFERGVRESLSRALDDDPDDHDHHRRRDHHRHHGPDRDDGHHDHHDHDDHDGHHGRHGHHHGERRDRGDDRGRGRDRGDDRDRWEDRPGGRGRGERPRDRTRSEPEEYRELRDQLSDLASRLDRISGADR